MCVLCIVNMKICHTELVFVVFQLEDKFDQEMEEHKQRLDKEYETLMQNFQRELEQLKQKHDKEIDRKVCVCHAWMTCLNLSGHAWVISLNIDSHAWLVCLNSAQSRYDDFDLAHHLREKNCFCLF